jgi:hypothetical protein
MNQIDINILELLANLKKQGMVSFDSEFCEKIGLLKQNLLRIKKGVAHFTPEHIQQMCKVYKINANYIFGFSKKMQRQ